MANLVRIFKFMKKWFILYVISIIILAILELGFQLIISSMFRSMFDFIEVNDSNGMIDVLWRYSLYTIIIFASFPLFIFITEYATVKTTGNIRTKLFSKLQRISLVYFKKNHSGEIISKMTNDVLEVENTYSRYFIRFLSGLLTGIGTTIYMFFLEWRLAIIGVIGGLLTLLINLYYSKLLQHISAKIQDKLAQVSKRLTNILDGITVIRVFNIYNIITKKYDDDNQELLNQSVKRVKTQAVVDSLNALVGIIGYIVMVIVGAYLILTGEISVGILIAVEQLQNGIIILVNSLGQFITQIQSSIASSKRIFAILDEDEEPINYINNENEVNDENIAISFNDVNFGYDNDQILHNVSYNLPKGKVYALVGPSGGGKSTLFKLILNFYPLQSGDIKIYGNSNLSIKEIRDLVAYVPQDAHLFTGTILENIEYGKVGATIDEIKNAARLANAEEFILEMKDGYNTFIGENGAQLSGGQRQRIAIARAILKNAPILLLDEATSALDNESEKLVQIALDYLMKDKTTLIIAHRLSTIQNADKIIVIKDGTIVEEGSHNDLLNDSNGVYYQLYQNQFAKA